MKPTSIIFLIVSLVIVLVGLGTAGIASRLAVSQEIELGMTAAEDGNYYSKPEFDAENIGKINISVERATVNIIGGSDKSYVELVNFADGMYAAASTNRVFTLSDGEDLASFSGIVSMVSNFSGLRAFVDGFNMRKLERTVNVYLNSDYPVNAVEISLGEGVVNIKNNRTLTDYYVNVEEGDVNITDVGTTSVVKVTVGEGRVKVDDCDIEQMSVNVKSGDVTAVAQINRFSAAIETGDFSYSFYSPFASTNVKLAASSGVITVDGNTVGGYMQTSDAATGNMIDAVVSFGDITIKAETPR